MRHFEIEPKKVASMAANVALTGVALYLNRKNRALHYESTHDKLTGQLNTRGLEELLSKNRPPRAILYADSTHLKLVNDEYGHPRGDEAVKETARVLADSLRPDDVIARVGGDEFLVLLDPKRRESSGRAQPTETLSPVISRIAEKTDALLGLPENADLVAVEFDIAVGGAVWRQGMSVDDLKKSAEQNMYRVKAIQHDQTISPPLA